MGRTGRPPFALGTMLRVHFPQLWFTLSDPAMHEAFFDTPLYREFAQLQELSRLLNESTTLRFRHRLEKYKLAGPILATINGILIKRGLLLKLGAVVDATLIAALSSTKNLKASVRAKVEHPFRVIKRQLGCAKVRYRGLKKNTAQLVTRFALSNLWMARSKLLAMQVARG